MGKLYNSIEISHEISGSIWKQTTPDIIKTAIESLADERGLIGTSKNDDWSGFPLLLGGNRPCSDWLPASFFTMNGQVSTVSGYSRPIKAAVYDLILYLKHPGSVQKILKNCLKQGMLALPGWYFSVARFLTSQYLPTTQCYVPMIHQVSTLTRSFFCCFIVVWAMLPSFLQELSLGRMIPRHHDVAIDAL